jgi:hypothetical protein
MIGGRALEIAKTAIVNVFKRGGETTVTLPKDWSLYVSASRTIRDVTELKVRLVNVLYNFDEIIYYKEPSSVMMEVEEPFFAFSYVTDRAVTSVTTHGRFRLKVTYRVGEEGVTVAEIAIKKV